MVAAVAGIGATVGARRAAATIRDNIDPFPEDVLRADVVGDEHVVSRPDGTRVRTVVAGEGADVVLLHGYGVSMREWNVVQARLLERGHRVLCVDWRGHGGSTIGADGITPEVIAEDIDAVLEHHDVQDAVLVGHSTGGYVAIATLLGQAAAAQRIRGLVLFASLAGDAAVDAPQTAAQIPLITSGLLQRLVARETPGLLFAASIYGPGAPPVACSVFLEEFLAQDHQALVPLLQRLATTSFYDRLDRIEVPTVVVCGEADSTTPRWHSERMGADIPNARNVWVPDAGHMLNWQAPEVLLDAVASLTEGATA